MRKRLKRMLPVLLLPLFFIIAGCGFGTNDTGVEIDPPQDVNYVDEGEELDQQSQGTGDEEGHEAEETSDETSDETVKRQLFLLDSNGMVAPQMVEVPVPESKEVAKQALEYLVKDGPVSNVIPNGFQAVLPAGTQILGVNIKDGTAIADFSEEFKEYQAEDEQKILQAITWTLTQFDSIDKVQLRINGYDQDVMPVDGTPIGDGFSRADGINVDTGTMTDLTNSVGVTVYFLAQSSHGNYYVPVTKRVQNEENNITATIKGLAEGPSLASGLFSDFSRELELLEANADTDGKWTLNFNEALLNNQKAISDEALNALILSLTEHEEVKEFAIQVNGEENVLTESGDALAQPVTREMMMDTMEF